MHRLLQDEDYGHKWCITFNPKRSNIISLGKNLLKNSKSLKLYQLFTIENICIHLKSFVIICSQLISLDFS